MALFNIGLTYGFTSLGHQAGLLLPAAYLPVASEPASPFYSPATGIFIVLSVVFALGFLATRAEPALQVRERGRNSLISVVLPPRYPTRCSTLLTIHPIL